MELNIWIRKDVTIFMGGDPEKGPQPTITGKLKKPQIIVDPEKGTIVIVETK